MSTGLRNMRFKGTSGTGYDKGSDLYGSRSLRWTRERVVDYDKVMNRDVRVFDSYTDFKIFKESDKKIRKKATRGEVGVTDKR